MKYAARLQHKPDISLALKGIEHIRVCLIEVGTDDGPLDLHGVSLDEIKH